MLDVITAVLWADEQIKKVPVVGRVHARVQGIVLDTLLGPADESFAVSTAAPNSPPTSA